MPSDQAVRVSAAVKTALSEARILGASMKFERLIEELQHHMATVVSVPRHDPQADEICRSWTLWCEGLRNNSTEFDQNSHGQLFSLLIRQFPMAEAPDDFFEPYKSAILAMCQIPWLLLIVLESFVALYFPRVAADSIEGQRVHTLILAATHNSPQLTPTFAGVIQNSFPWKGRGIEEHQHYLHNVLWTFGFYPILCDRVFETIVAKLLEIDVELDLEDPELEASLFPDEGVDGDGVFAIDEVAPSSGMQAPSSEQMELFLKLDVMMDMVFCFLRDIPPQVMGEMFATMMRVFSAKIFRAHQSRHTQFLLFFLCGRDAELSASTASQVSLSTAFVTPLLECVLDDRAERISRCTAANYLGSFLARFSKVEVNLVNLVLDRLLEYASAYEMENGVEVMAQEYVPDEPGQHAIFYAVFQSILYLLCFHGESLSVLRGYSSMGEFLLSLNVRALALSRLNPTFFSLPLVSREYSNLAEPAGAEALTDILDRNVSLLTTDPRTLLSRGDVSALQPGAGALFRPTFAFDPYLLRDSAYHILPIYRDWNSPEDEEGGVDGDEDEGDFSMERNHSVSFSASFSETAQLSNGTPEDLHFFG